MIKPDLQLSAGQVAWTLWPPMAGRPVEPPPKFLARLRYLQKEGVPFAEEEVAKGSGHNQLYEFDHLAELAVAIELINHGVRPGDVAALLVNRREEFRRWFKEAYERRGEEYFFDDPDLPLAQGLFIELTVTYSRDRPGIYEPKLLTPPEATKILLRLGRAKCSTFIIQLSQLLGRTVNRAEKAPEIPRGRPRHRSAE